MEELKLLIEMVSNLPSLAIWVLVGYLVYKIVVIGSIYGLARFGIEKLHDWLTHKAPRGFDPDKMVGVINDAKNPLAIQLNRIKRDSPYIHLSDVAWLERVLDEALKARRV